MATDIRADPLELTRLAATVRTASEELADARRTTRNPLAVPLTAYGNSNSASGVHAAHEATVDDADITVGRQVSILEDDVDRLYRVAFAYEKAELDAQQNLIRSGGQP